jgi:hypothetical protein
MKEYIARLKKHPGVPVALTCQGMGFIAGFNRVDGNLTSALVGVGVMSLFWIPVLLTAQKHKE